MALAEAERLNEVLEPERRRRRGRRDARASLLDPPLEVRGDVVGNGVRQVLGRRGRPSPASTRPAGSAPGSSVAP